AVALLHPWLDGHHPCKTQCQSFRLAPGPGGLREMATTVEGDEHERYGTTKRRHDIGTARADEEADPPARAAARPRVAQVRLRTVRRQGARHCPGVRGD